MLRRPGAAKQAMPEAPDLPEQLQYLWGHFVEVLNGVPGNGMGPRAIGWCDLAAWQECAGERLEPWECRTLMALSDKRVEVQQSKEAKTPKA